jgi:predicted nucleic acid-binding Zn ribbon protein
VLPVQTIASSVLADIIRRQPPSPARTAFAWSIVAGPAMARATSVELRDHSLYVTARDARWGREINRARDVVLARLQSLLGGEPRDLHVLLVPRFSDRAPGNSGIGDRP